MKIAGLIIGILILLAGIIGAVVSLMMPVLTNNRVNIGEAMVGFIPSVVILVFGLILTVISAIFVLRGKRRAR